MNSAMVALEYCVVFDTISADEGRKREIPSH